MVRKVAMYLSAFLPMLFILWVKEILLFIQKIVYKPEVYTWSSLYKNPFLISEIAFMLLIGCYVLLLIKNNKKTATYRITLKKVKNRTTEYYLAYYSLFILALIEFSLSDVIDLVVIAMLLIVLGVVYIKNDLFFINPTINIFQSFIYEIEYDDDRTTFTKLVISRDRLFEGEEIDVDVSEFEFTFVRSKNEDRDETTN